MDPKRIHQDCCFPQEMYSYIEVQKNTRTKYEYDEKLKALVLDRVLHSAVFYPHNYGYIPETLGGDGDPLDVLVITSESLMPGTYCKVRPICHLIMEDEKGKDEKLVAVCINDPTFGDIHKKDDLPNHMLNEISVFFETYKILEKKKWVKVTGWSNEEETQNLIKNSYSNYIAKSHNLIEISNYSYPL